MKIYKLSELASQEWVTRQTIHNRRNLWKLQCIEIEVWKKNKKTMRRYLPLGYTIVNTKEINNLFNNNK